MQHPLLAFAFLLQLESGWIIRIVSVALFFLTMSLLSLATYTAEIYPTHLRALGGGGASACPLC